MPSQAIQKEHKIDRRNACSWFQFCREVVLYFIESKSKITGGEGKVVDIDENKFGKRKYHRGHCVKGQLVFGGVESGSDRTFLVVVHDRSADSNRPP